MKMFEFWLKSYKTVYLTVKLMSLLVQVVAWCQTGNKSLPEPMMTYMLYVYMHLYASVKLKLDNERDRHISSPPCTILVLRKEVWSQKFIEITVMFLSNLQDVNSLMLIMRCIIADLDYGLFNV